MFLSNRYFLALTIFFVFNCLPAYGQAVVPENAVEQDWATGMKYAPATSVDNGPGHIGMTKTESEVTCDFKIFKKLPVSVSLDASHADINNTTAVAFPAHLESLSVNTEATLPFFNLKNTYFRLGLTPSFYADTWEFPASAFRMLTHSVVIYQPNQKWTFLVGVATFSRFKEDVLPILGFIYQPDKKWLFSFTPEDTGVYYHFNDKLTFFVMGDEIFDSEYFISRRNEKTILRYEEISIGSGVKYALNSHMDVSISGGEVFNRFLKFVDEEGKADIKPGFYVEVRTGTKF